MGRGGQKALWRVKKNRRAKKLRTGVKKMMGPEDKGEDNHGGDDEY